MPTNAADRRTHHRHRLPALPALHRKERAHGFFRAAGGLHATLGCVRNGAVRLPGPGPAAPASNMPSLAFASIGSPSRAPLLAQVPAPAVLGVSARIPSMRFPACPWASSLTVVLPPGLRMPHVWQNIPRAPCCQKMAFGRTTAAYSEAAGCPTSLRIPWPSFRFSSARWHVLPFCKGRAPSTAPTSRHAWDSATRTRGLGPFPIWPERPSAPKGGADPCSTPRYPGRSRQGSAGGLGAAGRFACERNASAAPSPHSRPGRKSLNRPGRRAEAARLGIPAPDRLGLPASSPLLHAGNRAVRVHGRLFAHQCQEAPP